ncbi:MAG: DsrE family protein [Prochloraceae cyanobacterium]|nr:DsrE family protein [Prochloraceae cyanobacterium]
MKKYFLIESRNPWDSQQVDRNYQIAADLAKAGNEVTLFMVENAVLATRSSAKTNGLTNLKQVKLLADDFSLKERGIMPSEIFAGIEVASINAVVDAMANKQKMIWL